MEERIGEAHDLGIQLTVLGRKLQPGDKAPDFSLDHYDGTTMKTIDIFTLVLLIYLAMSLAITALMRVIEAAASRGLARGRAH